MPEPTEFPKQKIILGAPSDWNAEKNGECLGLPVTTNPNNEDALTSVWVFSEEEKAKIAAGGKLCMEVHARAHPAVRLTIVQEGEFPLDGGRQ